jgi:hypothetical protein
MAERMLITKLVRYGDRADLYARGHQYKDLTLFALSDLADVGIDYANLPQNEPVPCRFWAYYELSDKLNKAGRPYKDVIGLEPMDQPATTLSTDNTALLAELRVIRALLTTLVEAQGLPLPVAEPEAGPEEEGDNPFEQTFPRYGDGSTLSENPAETAAYHEHVAVEGRPPASVEDLRAWVKARHG